MSEIACSFPPALETLPAGETLWQTLAARAQAEPVLAWASVLFLLAIIHTFAAPFVTHIARRCEKVHPLLARFAELFGEVEFVFILWAVPLFFCLAHFKSFETAIHYFGASVNYREPLFVVTIMALAATRPILLLSERIIGVFARLLGGDGFGWWLSLLLIGPLLGSFITEPAAMTITAMLLAKKFYDAAPSKKLSYATLGLLFVNVSVGGTLTHFAAPPVVMVSEAWGFDTAYMFMHFGWRAMLGILVSVLFVAFLFRKELLALKLPPQEVSTQSAVPWWMTAVHLLLIGWVVFTAHYMPLFVFALLAGFWFVHFSREYQTPIAFLNALRVGIFLAGLVIFGNLQQWWISPVIGGLQPLPLFAGSTILTAFNDNAAIAYLASLVPNLSDAMKFAVLAGAVTGGGLTIIANAPNPAGFTILKKYFRDAVVNPLGLLLAALVPTLILAWFFMGV